MTILLSKKRLNTLRQTIYGSNIQAVFYKVTPAAGPVEIGRIISGFYMQRERRAGQEIDGSGVRFWMSADAAIDRSLLQNGARVDLIIDGRTMIYTIVELLPMQQLGSGYTMRLSPQKGATA
jgi:hypothetical protein